MNSHDLATFKRAISTLGFQNKTRLTRPEIDRLIQELTLNRDYNLADYLRSMDPAQLNELLR
jgi:hypothetical protein